MAIATGGTDPIGMHSCFVIFSNNSIRICYFHDSQDRPPLATQEVLFYRRRRGLDIPLDQKEVVVILVRLPVDWERHQTC